MERPFCPLCKTNHFAREPHVWPEKKRVVMAEEKKETVVEAPKKKFDRVAYQREYMRKWRAKK